jgi:voltage-gated potassium channel
MTVQTSAPESRRLEILNKYEAKTSFWLSALALVYLVAFSAQAIFYDPSATWYRYATIFGNVLWVLFAADLAFRLALTPHRWAFIKTNIIDVITVVIPQLRALRVLRAFAKDGVLSKKKGAVSGRAVVSAVVGTVLIVWVGSLMVLGAERGAQGAEITSFGDAVWWSFETITTVGYGDFVPVTWPGRFYATLIMLVGISVLGMVTASLAATLVKQAPTAAPPAPTTPAPQPAGNDEVLKELAELKQMVAQLQAQLSSGR